MPIQNTIKEWDKEFYENGRRDIITVKAQGLEDQKGTKKDLGHIIYR